MARTVPNLPPGEGRYAQTVSRIITAQLGGHMHRVCASHEVLRGCVSRCTCRHIATAAYVSDHPSHPIQSHYENLKVSRDAPVEVIRAAYRALCRKYHPDRQTSDPDAALVMPLLNAAYETLSDPVKRRQHDEWIARVEAGLEESVAGESQERSPRDEQAAAASIRSVPRGRRHGAALLVCAAIASMILLILVGAHRYLEGSAGPRLAVQTLSAVSKGTWPGADSVAQSAGYARRPFAPNGMAWPEASGYVEGYARLHNDGAGSVILDNSANQVDVFAKLIAHHRSGSDRSGVRAVFIRAGGRFTLESLRAGTYEVHYLDLDRGIVHRSETFTVPGANAERGASAVVVALPAATGSLRDPQVTSSDDF